jgi:hypothetical protein
MRLIKATCVLLFTLALLAVPATQAVSHGVTLNTAIRDLVVGPYPPGN